jgi:hypothetical protein
LRSACRLLERKGSSRCSATNLVQPVSSFSSTGLSENEGLHRSSTKRYRVNLPRGAVGVGMRSVLEWRQRGEREGRGGWVGMGKRRASKSGSGTRGCLFGRRTQSSSASWPTIISSIFLLNIFAHVVNSQPVITSPYRTILIPAFGLISLPRPTFFPLTRLTPSFARPLALPSASSCPCPKRGRKEKLQPALGYRRSLLRRQNGRGDKKKRERERELEREREK